MRIAFSVLFFILIALLIPCAFIAKRSRKPIGASVALFLSAIIPPILGNLIIVASGNEIFSSVGCYFYFLGMDLSMYGLLVFTFDYCVIKRPNNGLKRMVNLLLIIDAIQVMLNPFIGHVFDTEMIMLNGYPYYRIRPYLGLTFHRIVDYGIFFACFFIFVYKARKSPRYYKERYIVIIVSLAVTCASLTYFIFSRTPIDRSMVCLGVFGILVYHFSIHYRPLRLLDRMLADLASDIPDALFLFDMYQKCIWANSAALRLVKVENEEYDKCFDALIDLFGPPNDDREDWMTRRIVGHGDDARYYTLEWHTLKDEVGRSAGVYMSVRDNTAEQQTYQQEFYNATHDSLTGIFTREYLYEMIHKTLMENPDETYYVVFVDVKNFKIVNDIFGTNFGDYALKCIAKWISTDICEDCVYGRLAGDTFGICLPKKDFDEQMLDMQLQDFIVVNGSMEHHILIHLGVYEVIDRNIEVSVMFDRAHLALSHIKDEYQKHITYYDDEMRKKVVWDQNISAQLHEAITLRQLRPYLQPIADSSGKIVGCEALVRWIHPENGFMPPGAFIPVFEKNGMIVEVDRYMWRCACEILSSWKEKGIDLFISVNISPKDFYFMDVNSEIRKLVKKYDVDPKKLRIEITESVMMDDLDNRMDILRQFRREGFIVEMDDFGSGFSSLNMLKDMPVDVLKIDMNFLGKSTDDQRSNTIVQNIINLTRDLEIESLTEGVETEIQYKALAKMGCRLFQGYYFAKPMPVDEFMKFCSLE